MAAAPNPKRQKVDNEDGQTSVAVNLKGLFTKDRKYTQSLLLPWKRHRIFPSFRVSLIRVLRSAVITMMYGFGDDENPLPETVELTEVSKQAILNVVLCLQSWLLS